MFDMLDSYGAYENLYMNCFDARVLVDFLRCPHCQKTLLGLYKGVSRGVLGCP